MILALDTTGEYGSIALGLDRAMPHSAGTLDEMELHAPEGFTQVLYGYVWFINPPMRTTAAPARGCLLARSKNAARIFAPRSS